MLLQTAVGVAEVSAGWSGFMLALSTAALGLVVALGVYGTAYINGRREINQQDVKLKQQQIALQQKEQELKQLEVEEKIAATRRRIALDAAAIVEEQARDQKLSGAAKQSLAAAKVEELLNASAAPNVEGSALTDLVKLGVSLQRQTSATTYLVTPSNAPPPEQPLGPQNKLPAPAPIPANAPLTRTSPERPGAKR